MVNLWMSLSDNHPIRPPLYKMKSFTRLPGTAMNVIPITDALRLPISGGGLTSWQDIKSLHPEATFYLARLVCEDCL